MTPAGGGGVRRWPNLGHVQNMGFPEEGRMHTAQILGDIDPMDVIDLGLFVISQKRIQKLLQSGSLQILARLLNGDDPSPC